jgi:DNA helicase II / ATP-dependent DNA helicase PcrA
LADVCAQRFPSSFSARIPDLPLAGAIADEIDVAGLADNQNKDGERRLMYVAITRAERFLFISRSGTRTSRFVKELSGLVQASGGVVTDNSQGVLKSLKYAPKEHYRDTRLATSFSDLRYYLECPHDFYLRKVLGFAPTIDQAFGYGRGVHNLMRAIHSEPKRWAALASDPSALEREVQRLIDRGLFYLRYTTGEPAQNMRAKGAKIVADYIRRYVGELQTLDFEPEREFETLVEYEDEPGGALVNGAIDVVRQDNPPRVTLIDFKSGDADSDKHQKLDEEEMRLQVGLYALAVKKELEYEPEQGLVRYLGSNGGAASALKVPLDTKSLTAAKQTIAITAARIRDRQFKVGPVVRAGGGERCDGCDFVGFCGMEKAITFKGRKSKSW